MTPGAELEGKGVEMGPERARGKVCKTERFNTLCSYHTFVSYITTYLLENCYIMKRQLALILVATEIFLRTCL